MKKLLAAMVLCALPSVAWGFTLELRAASGNISLGSQVYESDINMDVLRCPSTGCATTLHTTFPREATTNSVGWRLNHTSPDVAPNTGSIVTQVCAWVVPPGAKLSQIPTNLACSFIATSGVLPSAQWSLLQDSYGGLATFVNQADGTACTPAACGGGEMFIVIARLNSGTSTANDDFLSLTAIFQ